MGISSPLKNPEIWRYRRGDFADRRLIDRDKDALIARLTSENAALKKENEELGMERDVLKRCMVLWVK
ncbi:hypothetical protein ACFY2M_05095 [Streptomyces sp. NPDC001276]|uniref:hypothetical protein n=1 Tax=Streptomyces sp. NPDC001276 TaxID=3364555 RepID=UPI003690A32F